MTAFLPRISCFVGCFLLCSLFFQCYSQVASNPAPDSAKGSTITVKSGATPADTTVRTPFQPNPKRAGLYSAIVPGLGQAYNRQYWKVPVIYGGLAVAGYFFVNNLDKYRSYRSAYVGRLNNPYPTDKYVNIYSTPQLQQLQDEYNKYLNLTVLFTGIGYSLQIVEAITAAHLKNFDVSRDISLRIKPVMNPNGPAVGLVLVINK